MSEHRKKIYLLTISLLMLSSVAISFYLLHHHILVNYSYTLQSGLCSVHAKLNCDAAAKSSFSTFLGVPISLWGLGLYIVMFSWTLLIFKDPKSKNYLLYLLFLVFLGSVFYSVALGLISWLIIKVLCPFCIALYVVNATTFFLAFMILRNSLNIASFTHSIKMFLKSKTFVFSIVLFGVFVALGLYYKKMWPYQNPNSVLFYNTYPKQLDTQNTDYFSKGDLNSPVRMDIFTDFQCPFCQKAHHEIDALLEKTGLTNKVVVFYHHFPLDKKCNPHMGERILHEDACEASRFFKAVEGHNDSDEIFKSIFEVTLEKSGEPFKKKVSKIVKSFQIPESVFDKMATTEIKKNLQKEITEALSWKIKETPSVFINGYFVPYKISSSEDFFRKIIEREL